ncbi:MAG: hypothetical protein GTO14_11495 [Anaerolineales bacterium]|nr:hypothetical protein [Anaerolineales bacterium]
MLLGLISWVVSTFFVLGITYLAHRSLRTDRTDINAVSYVFLSLFFGTLFMLLMGLAGFLAPLPILFVSVLGFIILIGVPSTREALSAVRGGLIEFSARLKRGWMELPRWLRWFTLIFTIASAIRFIFLIWTFPPFVWDSLTYHMTNVAEWTQKGRIFIVEAPVVRVALPSNFEVFATWFTVFIHHDLLVEAAGIPAYILAFLAILTLARTLGMGGTAAWIAGLGYLSTPALILATTGTKNDPQMAALFLTSVVLVTEIAGRKEFSRERNLIGQAFLLIMVVLYALGTKIYLLHLLPGLLFIGIFEAIRNGQGRIWIELPARIMAQWRDLYPRDRWWLVVGLTAGLFIGGYWNVRNALIFGNPFYPFGLKYGDQVVFEATHKFFPLGLERLPQNLQSFAEKFGDKQFKIIPALRDTTGWGWLGYALGVPALLWALLRRPKMRVLIAGFVLSLLALFVSTRPSPFNMRYVIWFPAVLALGFAALYDWIPQHFRFERLAFSAIFCICVGLNLWLTLNYNRITIEQFGLMLKTPAWHRDAAKLTVYVPEEYPAALEYVPNGELLGYNVHLNGFIYPLYRADYSQWLTYIPISSDGDCESLVTTMKNRGTRFLFTSEEMTDAEILNSLRGCEDAGYLGSPKRGLYVLSEN